MDTLYVISKKYSPSTAQTNRLLAFVKGFGELGTDVKVIYLMPDSKHSKINYPLDNVEFLYLWDGGNILNKYYIFLRSLIRVLKYIKRGSSVLVYYKKILSVIPLFFITVKLYHERTEHPDVVRNTNSIIGNLMYKIYLYNCRRLDGLFVITNNLKTHFVSQGMKIEKITVVNMVVDGSRFDNVRAYDEGEKYIAYCGTVSVGKDGVDQLIEVFHKVALVVDDVKLYVIGSFISDSDRDAIYKIVERYQLKNRVVFTGKVDFNQMPALLSNSKMLILTRPDNKQAKYGFPTKLGEYLMSERPTVVTRTGEIDIYLNDNETALIVEPDNIDSIAEKTIWALHNYDSAQIIGRKGREVAMLNFNYKIEASKILSVIFKKG